MEHVGVLIADVHWGVMPDKQLRFELDEIFINYISSLKRLDFIVILGDWFDHKLYLNTQSANSAIYYMDKIISIAKSKGAKIRVVYGTESHECSQYDVFSTYETKSEYDFKVIKTVSSEELFPDMKVLYIPEEHITDKKDYYNDYFKDNHYNYIFGHGVIQEAMTTAVKHTEKVQKKLKVPVFTSKELTKIADDVYFGHYHIHTDIEPFCHYIGSFSRWQFGQEEDKGFYLIKCNTKKHEWNFEFIVNHLAERYITKLYNMNDDIFKSQENLVKECDKADIMIRDNLTEHLRLIINIPDGFSNETLYTDFLKERFSSNPKIKVVINSKGIKQDEEDDQAELDMIDDKYSYLFDNTSIEEQIRLFILNEYDTNIDREKVKFYLTRNERN